MNEYFFGTAIISTLNTFCRRSIKIVNIARQKFQKMEIKDVSSYSIVIKHNLTAKMLQEPKVIIEGSAKIFEEGNVSK